MSNLGIPGHRARHRLSAVHLARLAELARVTSRRALAAKLGTAEPTLDAVLSGGAVMARTIAKIAARIDGWT